MKTSLTLCLLLLVTCLGAATARAAADPADRFLDGYFLIQEGDAAEKAGDWAKATAKFKGALDILAEINKSNPEWNPHIIEFRTKYCNDHLTDIATKMPAAPTPPTPTPEKPVVPVPPTPTVEKPKPAEPMPPSPEEMAKIKQLQDELDRAHEQIKQIEMARDDVNAKLQDALKKIPPTETTPQIEKLMKENRDLAAQLATAQTQMAELKERSKPAPVKPAKPEVSPELIALRSQLGEARAELKRTKDELNQARAELNSTKGELTRSQAEVKDLRAKYDAVVAQLTDANRKLSSARQAAQKDDEIIRQLRKENSSLKLMVERKSISPILPRQEEVEAGPTIPELKGWHPFNRRERVEKPKPAKEPTPVATQESGKSKLVASVTAPPSTPSPSTPISARPAAPMASSPENVALLNEAHDALAKHEYDMAAANYDKVLATEPNNLAALSSLGIVRYRQGKLDDAEPVLRKATNVAPNDSAAHSLLGAVYLRKGQTDAAFTELTRAVALNPKNAEAHNYLGICHSEKGSLPSAEKEIRKAIELNPQYADAHFNLAVIYLKEKPAKTEMARVNYKKAIELGAEPDPKLEAMLGMPSAPKPAPPKAEAPAPPKEQPKTETPAPAPTPEAPTK